MKVLCVNLPNKDRIVRRFCGSYNSPSFLFPPQELLSCAAALKSWNKAEVFVVDAIAEKRDLDSTIDFIRQKNPDMVVTMIGMECFSDDIKVVTSIKSSNPGAKMTVFGYYPSMFSREVFKNTNIDYIVQGEPELCLSKLVKAMEEGTELSAVPGLIQRGDGKSVPPERMMDLDQLPFPDPSMLATNNYKEMLMRGPIALIQSARGCPFSCNYCVTSYGRKVVMRSPENILAEIEFLVEKGFREFRFTDDTFIMSKARVEKMCELITRKKLRIKWTCLSRVDSLDRGLLALMKKAGCKRIYIGIESFSQKVLDYYEKGIKASDILERIEWVREVGIQSSGFMMIGAPVETADDITENKDGLRRSKLDFVIVSKLTPYSGTPLFERLKDSMEFTLFPYHNFFKDMAYENRMIAIEKELYRAFYWRPNTLFSLFRIMVENPRDFFNTGVLFLKFMLAKDQDKQHPNFI